MGLRPGWIGTGSGLYWNLSVMVWHSHGILSAAGSGRRCSPAHVILARAARLLCRRIQGHKSRLMEQPVSGTLWSSWRRREKREVHVGYIYIVIVDTIAYVAHFLPMLALKVPTQKWSISFLLPFPHPKKATWPPPLTSQSYHVLEGGNGGGISVEELLNITEGLSAEEWNSLNCRCRCSVENAMRVGAGDWWPGARRRSPGLGISGSDGSGEGRQTW